VNIRLRFVNIAAHDDSYFSKSIVQHGFLRPDVFSQKSRFKQPRDDQKPLVPMFFAIDNFPTASHTLKHFVSDVSCLYGTKSAMLNMSRYAYPHL